MPKCLQSMADQSGVMRDRCRKDLHGGPSFCSGRGGDKSSMGESESVHRSQDAVFFGCLQHGMASAHPHTAQWRWEFREGSIGLPGLMLCLLLLRLSWAQQWLTRVFLPLFRFMGSVNPHSASLSFWISWPDSYHFLYWNQQWYWEVQLCILVPTATRIKPQTPDLLREQSSLRDFWSFLWLQVWQHSLPDHLRAPAWGWGWLLLCFIYSK
jgi:hypothetical protein